MEVMTVTHLCFERDRSETGTASCTAKHAAAFPARVTDDALKPPLLTTVKLAMEKRLTRYPEGRHANQTPGTINC